MNKKQKIKIGKFLSLILRHNPNAIGVKLDESGWLSVEQLLHGLKNKGQTLSFEELEDIVIHNDKKRYCFNEDKTQIRANQGHSLEIDLVLKKITPPDILYHGTALRFMKSIQQQGLIKKNRHHVHLSIDKEIAYKVGSRHGKPIVLCIASKLMDKAGFSFYCSANGVWLVDAIPVKYLSKLN